MRGGADPARRDDLCDRFGLAGLVPPRPGSPRDAAWLSSPHALALRLQRASILGWSAAVLYAAFPRALPVTWAVLAYGVVAGFFAPVLELPDSAVSVSPFEHVGEYLAEDIAWPAVGILAVLAVALVAVAIAAYRRHDLVTTA